MKSWKGIFLGGVLLAALAVVPFGLTTLQSDNASPSSSMQKVGISYGERRPFSWYYPEKYQYYYPRRPVYDACYWVYTNGVYVYTCN